MQRKPRPEDPRLEKLLDERDHLRIRINLVESGGEDPDDILTLRRMLQSTDRHIMNQWTRPAD